MSGFFERLFPRPVYPVADEDWQWVLAKHPILRGFSADRLAALRQLSEQFLARKQLYPVGDLEIDGRLLASIAAQACLPVLELGLSWYRSWSTLVLTADEFDVETTDVDEAGVVHEGIETASGQILPLGSVFLSIRDVDASGWGDGYNVVIHEMAHVLDRGNGELDGAPLLHREMDLALWTKTFTGAYLDLQQRIVAGPRRSGRATHAPGKRGGRPAPARPMSGIDPYAAEAPEEFFAVVSETFFEQPWVLDREYPQVYGELRAFYRQDPLARLPGPRRR